MRDPRRYVAIKNNSGLAIPPFSVAVADGTATTDGAIGVIQAFGDNLLQVIFTWGLEIPIDGVGQGNWPVGSVVAGLHQDDLPLGEGSMLGVKSLSWELRKGQSGFRSVGPSTGGVTEVMFPVSGGSQSHYARITGRTSSSPFRYSHVQVVKGPTGVFGDLIGGITGTTASGYAQDIGPVNPVSVTVPVLLTSNPAAPGTYLFGPMNGCA